MLGILVHLLKTEEVKCRASRQEALTGAPPRLGFVAPEDNSLHVHTLRQANYSKQRGRKSVCVHERQRITWPQNKQQRSPGTESHFLDSCVGKRKAAKLRSLAAVPAHPEARPEKQQQLDSV